MDSSNLAHFCFSFFIPLGWAAILLPFARARSRGWPWFFLAVLLISIVIICAKELIDTEASINDIVSDILGFFLGTTLLSQQFHRWQRALQETDERMVAGHAISLRGTLSLIEKIERRSADFYQKAAGQLSGAREGGVCLLLARDAMKRANRVQFTLAGWRTYRGPNELSDAIEHAFSGQQIFSLDFATPITAEAVLRIALEHEKKKLSLFSKFESAFHEKWKLLSLGRVLGELRKEIQKLELCLRELEKEKTAKPA